jgi:RNA polymerase sigma-70 factor (ECF subfamily)
LEPLEISALIERCRGGDGLAWEALVRRYQSRVYSVTLHYLRDEEEARDAAQDVFVRVYRRLDTFQGGARFLPWLLRLARNASIDRIRRRAARPPGDDLVVGETVELAAEGPGPEEQLGRRTRRRLLWRAVAGLSDPHREMILLHEIQGLKLEEIAEMLRLPLGTVKSRSNRARVELASRVRELDPAYGAPAS